MIADTNNYNTIAISTLHSPLDHTFYCPHRRFLVTATTMLIPLPPGSSPFFTGSCTEMNKLSASLMLRPTVSRPVCHGIKHPSGAYDHISITVRQLRVYWCGALSLTRGRVCRLQLLLALVGAAIYGSESRGTGAPLLLSQIRDIPFRRLLRVAGLR
jgi:hypothetical protein